MMYKDILNSPVGLIEITASDTGISGLGFVDDKNQTPEVVENTHTKQCKTELVEYFDNVRKTFTVALAPIGTEFQKHVWSALSQIPFGSEVSYKDIAKTINNPKAMRAVGAANGRNPISIIVPCHRVIGADKTLTGYAWGLKRKAWLLNHENIAFKMPKPLNDAA